MSAALAIRDRVADHLAHNPEAVRIQMDQHEEIVNELRTRITLLQKLYYRELAWRTAVTAWLIADRETLIVTLAGVPHLVHSLYETDDYACIKAAILVVAEGGIQTDVVRYLCDFCKDVRCGGETQCASDVDHSRVMRIRIPKDVLGASERVVEVRKMAEVKRD